MIKSLKVNNSIPDKIRIICNCAGIDISMEEEVLLAVLYARSSNMEITMTKGARALLLAGYNYSDSQLSTMLYRLKEKGLIARQNKIIILNPMFKDLDQLTGVLVKFE